MKRETEFVKTLAFTLLLLFSYYSSLLLCLIPFLPQRNYRRGRDGEHGKSSESLSFFFLLLFIWHSFGFVTSISKLADMFQPCSLPLFVFRCSCLLLKCGLVKLFTKGYSFVGPLICEYSFFFFSPILLVNLSSFCAFPLSFACF